MARQFDTITRNHIAGWTLLTYGMSGEAFSTALAHAAHVDMGDAIELGDLGYDLCGRPVQSEDLDDARIALTITVTAMFEKGGR